MPSVNKLIIIGHVGQKPELRNANGKAVCNFSVAVNDGKKDAPPIWFRISAWDKLAENCAQYLDKGRAVYVEGRVGLEEWSDKKTGEVKHSLKVTAGQVTFLGGGERGSAPAYESKPPAGDDDQIPF